MLTLLLVATTMQGVTPDAHDLSSDRLIRMFADVERAERCGRPRVTSAEPAGHPDSLPSTPCPTPLRDEFRGSDDLTGEVVAVDSATVRQGLRLPRLPHCAGRFPGAVHLGQRGPEEVRKGTGPPRPAPRGPRTSWLCRWTC